TYPDSIAMPVQMTANLALTMQGRSKDKTNIALSYCIRLRIPVSGLQPPVSQGLKAKSRLVVIGRLFGIAYIKLQVIDTQEWKQVGRLSRFPEGLFPDHRCLFYIVVYLQR